MGGKDHRGVGALGAHQVSYPTTPSSGTLRGVPTADRVQEPQSRQLESVGPERAAADTVLTGRGSWRGARAVDAAETHS